MAPLQRPLFIVGLPRSGSTLLQNILVMERTFCRLGEMHYLTPWKRDFRRLYQEERYPQSAAGILAALNRAFSGDEARGGLSAPFWRQSSGATDLSLRRQIAARAARDPGLGGIFRALLEETTKAEGYSRACLKFPVYMNHVPELIKWYPDCRILHLTRDPRAVAVSKTRDSGTVPFISKYPYLEALIRKRNILSVSLQYVWLARLHRRFSGSNNYLLVRYEDLLWDPEVTLRNICGFANFEYSADLLKPEQGVHEHQPSSVTGRRDRGINPSAASRWQAAMSPAEKLLVTGITNTSMARLGFFPHEHPVYKVTERSGLPDVIS